MLSTPGKRLVFPNNCALIKNYKYAFVNPNICIWFSVCKFIHTI